MSGVDGTWRQAPVSPFVAITVNWRAVDRQDPQIELSGHSWMGWIAQAPADWSGVCQRLAALAPEGALAEVGALDSPDEPAAGDGYGEGAAWILSPRRPPGLGAPWIDSSESVHRDASSPHVLVLALTWVASEDVPREWSDLWHQRMTRECLSSIKNRFEAELSACGFARVWPMGLRDDVSGKDNWCNVATGLWPAWVAQGEALEIALSAAPAGRAKGSASI